MVGFWGKRSGGVKGTCDDLLMVHPVDVISKVIVPGEVFYDGNLLTEPLNRELEGGETVDWRRERHGLNEGGRRMWRVWKFQHNCPSDRYRTRAVHFRWK